MVVVIETIIGEVDEAVRFWTLRRFQSHSRCCCSWNLKLTWQSSLLICSHCMHQQPHRAHGAPVIKPFCWPCGLQPARLNPTGKPTRLPTSHHHTGHQQAPSAHNCMKQQLQHHLSLDLFSSTVSSDVDRKVNPQQPTEAMGPTKAPTNTPTCHHCNIPKSTNHGTTVGLHSRHQPQLPQQLQPLWHHPHPP